MFDVKQFCEQTFKKVRTNFLVSCSKLLNGQKFLYQLHTLVHLPDVGKFGHAVVIKGSGSEIRARRSHDHQRIKRHQKTRVWQQHQTEQR